MDAWIFMEEASGSSDILWGSGSGVLMPLDSEGLEGWLTIGLMRKTLGHPHRQGSFPKRLGKLHKSSFRYHLKVVTWNCCIISRFAPQLTALGLLKKGGKSPLFDSCLRGKLSLWDNQDLTLLYVIVLYSIIYESIMIYCTVQYCTTAVH